VPTDIASNSSYEIEPASTAEEADELTNPIEASARVIKRGQIAYGRYCSHCHGSLGRGWTSVGSSYDPTPPDLAQRIEDKSDGELFSIITFGRGPGMIILGPIVAIEDRWRIIHFLRTIPERREGVEPVWGQ
jgi:mono/diheme cytochrome c family protein